MKCIFKNSLSGKFCYEYFILVQKKSMLNKLAFMSDYVYIFKYICRIGTKRLTILSLVVYTFYTYKIPPLPINTFCPQF